MATSGRRHRLLLYARLFRMLRWPTLLIAVLCGVLWWFAPGVPWLASEGAQWALLGLVFVNILMFGYALIGPLLSYVQCRPTHLRISTPLYRLAISYNRIRTVRPMRFIPSRMRGGQRRFLEPFLGWTVVSLELNAYPISKAWLRLWLNDFMFTEEFTGLLLLTQDWMGLSREIDVYRGEWKMRRTGGVRSRAGNPFGDRR